MSERTRQREPFGGVIAWIAVFCTVFGFLSFFGGLGVAVVCFVFWVLS